VVFHRVDDADKRVVIVRILHGHLDLSADDFAE
jgi:plasmid stabilization system protein ParE